MHLPIIYLHIPKTAGTSFRKSAEQYFGPEQVLNDYGEDSSNTSEDIRAAYYDSKDVMKLKKTVEQHRFLTGHFTLAKYREIFPKSPVVTFFRNPVDRVISEYTHFVTHYSYKGDLREFYLKPQFQNRQHSFMSESGPECIDYFGITEEYEKSLQMFNRQFNTNFPSIQLNVGKYDTVSNSLATDDELAEILELNQKDSELYEAALAGFNSQQLRNEYFFKTSKRFCGRVGSIKQGKINGWTIDREITGPARVVVCINGRERKLLIANMLREDVQRKGFHVTGNCGFEFTLDELGSLSPGDSISIRIEDGDYELANSPVIVPTD